MRRAPFVIFATAAGLYGVLGFHTRKPALGLASGAPPSTSTPATTAPASGSPSTAGPSGPPTGSSSTTAPSANRSATGSLVQYGYGELSVKVTLSGRRITDVSLANIQVAEQTSQYIAQQAVPILRHEVLSAQTARIQAVSGATYTSEAYIRSLQAALTQLHV